MEHLPNIYGAAQLALYIISIPAFAVVAFSVIKSFIKE